MLEIDVQKKLLAAEGEILLDAKLNLAEGEFVALTGASGSGKTTLLRLIAGLTEAKSGVILCNHQICLATAQKINLSPQKRPVGIVFQDYALFPNMTVRQNLTYALQRGQAKTIVDELIQITELEALIDRYPNTLSGGQQQRVALARALVNQPRILLLDEALSALDVKTRSRLQDYILQLHQKYHLTILFVSHDISEIVKMSNRILALENGLIREVALSEILQEQASNTLLGKIIRIIQENNNLFAEIFIANSLTRIAISKEEAARFEKGETNIVLDIIRKSLQS
ncbi:MAG: ATP-binding cassette domain-containing protein [Saprospiraceae bacterium]|nr:ATP-binding cassette domain-containing protein [Saprospiraceae bacterium]